MLSFLQATHTPRVYGAPVGLTEGDSSELHVWVITYQMPTALSTSSGKQIAEDAYCDSIVGAKLSWCTRWCPLSRLHEFSYEISKKVTTLVPKSESLVDQYLHFPKKQKAFVVNSGVSLMARGAGEGDNKPLRLKKPSNTLNSTRF